MRAGVLVSIVGSGVMVHRGTGTTPNYAQFTIGKAAGADPIFQPTSPMNKEIQIVDASAGGNLVTEDFLGSSSTFCNVCRKGEGNLWPDT